MRELGPTRVQGFSCYSEGGNEMVMPKTTLERKLKERHERRNLKELAREQRDCERRKLITLANNFSHLSKEEPFGILFWRSCPQCGAHVSRYDYVEHLIPNSSVKDEMGTVWYCDVCDYAYSKVRIEYGDL